MITAERCSTTYFSSTTTFVRGISPPALKEISSTRFSITVCNLLAPISSLVILSSAAISAIFSIASGVKCKSILSTASGLLSAINMDRKLSGKESLALDQTTVLGALSNFVATPNVDFQPMNANFGIIAPIEYNPRKKAEKKRLMAERALQKIKEIKETL